LRRASVCVRLDQAKCLCLLYGNEIRLVNFRMWAGQRPLTPTGAALPRPRLYLGLLGHLEGIVDLNAEVTDRTLQLRVSWQ
jgi:hypothetical protein